MHATIEKPFGRFHGDGDIDTFDTRSLWFDVDGVNVMMRFLPIDVADDRSYLLRIGIGGSAGRGFLRFCRHDPWTAIRVFLPYGAIRFLT